MRTRSSSNYRPWLSAADQRRWRHSKRRRRPILVPLLVLAVIVLILVGGAARVLTETVPKLKAHSVLAASYIFPGGKPTLTWPTQGSASVAVVGLGSLGSSGTSAPKPMASVAKVMTAYVILHDFPLSPGQNGFEYTITAADVAQTDARAAQDQSVVTVSQGEQISEYQMLEGLLIPSGNNFAVILADRDAGSVSAFLAKMDATARSLGMNSTKYTDPSGFDATTVSTAADQVKLAEQVMRNPVFAKIVDEKSAALPVAGVVQNFDQMVGVDGFIGIKTGSDSTAGGAFMFADQRSVDGHAVTVYGVVLGQDVGQELTQPTLKAASTAAQHLADSVVASLKFETVLPAGSPVLSITNAAGQRVTASTVTALQRIGFAGMTVPLTLTPVLLGGSLPAGQHVARVAAGGSSAGGAGASVTSVTTDAATPHIGLGWKIRHIF